MNPVVCTCLCLSLPVSACERAVRAHGDVYTSGIFVCGSCSVVLLAVTGEEGGGCRFSCGMRRTLFVSRSTRLIPHAFLSSRFFFFFFKLKKATKRRKISHAVSSARGLLARVPPTHSQPRLPFVGTLLACQPTYILYIFIYFLGAVVLKRRQ